MQTPLNLHHRTDAELTTNLNQTLSRKKSSEEGVWLFVYGLLAKAPPFQSEQQKTVTLQGYQRRFNLADPLNRGTPAMPGLTLGLVPGGTCEGISYFIPQSEVHKSLTKVWQQEMLLPFYTPTWLEIDGTETLTMLTDPSSPALRPELALPETIRIISTAKGEAGTNQEYLSDVISAFGVHGIEDSNLTSISEALITQHAA